MEVNTANWFPVNRIIVLTSLPTKIAYVVTWNSLYVYIRTHVCMYNDKLRNTVTLMVAKEYGLGNKIFADYVVIHCMCV